MILKNYIMKCFFYVKVREEYSMGIKVWYVFDRVFFFSGEEM